MTGPRFLRATLALLLVAAVLAGCSPRGRRSAPTSAPTDAGRIGAVIDRLAVEGFTLEQARSGLRDLGATADLSEDPAAERAALERNGFVQSYAKLYVRGSYSVGALAYEFRTASGATGYMRYTIDDAKKNYGAALFSVRSIRGAQGQTQRLEEEGFFLRAVTFPRDTVVYSVVIAGPRIPAAEDVVRLAETLAGLAGGK